MRVLWVAGERPDPVDTGLHAYSAGASEALARAGAEVVGVAMARAGAPSGGGEVEWRLVDDRPRRAARSLASPLPNVASARATRAVRGAVRRALAGTAWDAVVLDHLQMAWAAPLVEAAATAGGRAPTVVYLAHNHEGSARRAIARSVETPWARRLPLLLDAAKAARLERRVLDRARLVVAITPEDADRFREDVPGTAVVVLTPGYGGRRVARRTLTADVPRRVVCLGSLHWHVKQANLVAFLDEADARFAAAGAEIVVVGPAPPEFVARVAPRLRATRFLGRVDDLAPVMADARIGVVPEAAGGGFKLKSLDYVFARVPMAVLDGSVAGLPLAPGRDLLSFPDAGALARGALAALDDLDLLNGLQARAYDACDAAFDWGTRGVLLHDAIAGSSS